MKVGEIWKAKDELKSFKKSPGFWDDPDSEDLLMTTDYIKLIEYIGNDGWRVQPMYPSAKIEELRQAHKKDPSLFSGSKMRTKFICEPMSERLRGSAIHRYYEYIGNDSSSYGPEPSYEMIFEEDEK